MTATARITRIVAVIYMKNRRRYGKLNSTITKYCLGSIGRGGRGIFWKLC